MEFRSRQRPDLSKPALYGAGPHMGFPPPSSGLALFCREDDRCGWVLVTLLGPSGRTLFSTLVPTPHVDSGAGLWGCFDACCGCTAAWALQCALFSGLSMEYRSPATKRSKVRQPCGGVTLRRQFSTPPGRSRVSAPCHRLSISEMWT